jgi:polyhydroxyalkanoate synthase
MMYSFTAADHVAAFLRVFTTQAAVAHTPRRPVWCGGKAKLFHYARTGGTVPRTPLLIIYSPIGRPTILDLYPGHSFVDWMRQRGFDVFLLDWGRPGPEDRSLGLSSYVVDYLPPVVRTVKKLTGSQECSMLGWSVGGLFSAIYAALFPDSLRNLILITAPLDFHHASTFSLPSFVDARGCAIDTVHGNVPGEMIALGAIAADPFHAAIRPYIDLLGHFADPKFMQHWHAIRTWASDLVPVTGALFRDLLVELYRNNRLMRNELMVGSQRVDLGQIRARLLNIVATEDRVSPPCQSEGLLQVVASRDKQNLRVRGTHIESMAGLRAPYETWPKIYEWLAERPNSKLTRAQVIPFPAR